LMDGFFLLLRDRISRLAVRLLARLGWRLFLHNQGEKTTAAQEHN
jgi:hypothetical protein